MKKDKFKDYIGDSVYADFDGYSIILTTENGYGPSNSIALEPEVYDALIRYIDRIKSFRRERMLKKEREG